MNLVQIQERLKDLPMQAIMGYANGQNPQVPPYLALGEMNRRKQMEKQAAQAPTGTVKDNIEQQVGLMQLQKLRQGQMAQQMGQQGMQSPTIPQGTPEPEMQPEAEMAMAGGGVTSLPVGDMNFGSGGIVAFANQEGKQLVEEDEDLPLWARQPRRERRKRLEEDRAKNMSLAANEGFTNPGMQNDPRLVGKTPPAETLGAVVPPPPPAANIVSTAPPRPVQAQPPVVQNAPVAPVAPAQSESDKYLSGILAGAQKPELPKPFEMPQQAPIGEDYLKYVTDREQKRREDALKFEDVQKGRSQRDFFNSLIAAGEATRGQKGIGALAGGFGKAYSQSATEAEDRKAAFENAQQEKADLDAKMKFEISNLRRAEARGDAKGAYDSKIEIAKIQQQQQANAITAATSISGTESRERTAAADIASREKIAEADRKARAALHGMPSYEQTQANKFIDSWKVANPGKPFHEAFTAFRAASSGSGERQDLNELKALQGNLQKQTENFTLPEEQRKSAAQQLIAVNAKISQMAGIGSLAPKTATMADVKTTAAKSGRTEQQVIDAMKANGYTIQ